MQSYEKRLNQLAIDVFDKYKPELTFRVSVFFANQRYFLREIKNMEGLCSEGNIDCVSFYPKKDEPIDVYPIQYVSHEIKDNKLEIKLKNKEFTFDLI